MVLQVKNVIYGVAMRENVKLQMVTDHNKMLVQARRPVNA